MLEPWKSPAELVTNAESVSSPPCLRDWFTDLERELENLHSYKFLQAIPIEASSDHTLGNTEWITQESFYFIGKENTQQVYLEPCLAI